MKMILRVLVGVIGLFALFGAGQYWFRLDTVFTEHGMQAVVAKLAAASWAWGKKPEGL